MHFHLSRPPRPYSGEHGRRAFWASIIAPPAAVLVLLVVLPLAGLWREGAVPAASAPLAPDAALAAELRQEARRLSDTLEARRRTEQFLQARLEMVRAEAIGAALDLPGGTLVLELGGVPLRRCRILRARVSPALLRRGPPAPSEGAPPMLFTLAGGASTIPRVPVHVVDAPKDTAEARAQLPADVPVETRPAHFALHFDRGLTLYAYAAPSGFRERLGVWVFRARMQLRDAGRVLSGLFRGRPEAHRLRITLELAPEDARSVHRALPADARLAVGL